jgi:hypothetical protein
MAIGRTTVDVLRIYLFDLALSKAVLLDERAALLKAQDRITEIDAEVAEFDVQLQPAIDKINSIDKTNLTIADVQERVRPTKPVPIPPSVDPVQVAFLEAEKRPQTNGDEK